MVIMKQTTIFDFYSRTPNKLNSKSSNNTLKENQNIHQKNELVKSYIQKNISEIITQQKKSQEIKELLGHHGINKKMVLDLLIKVIL